MKRSTYRVTVTDSAGELVSETTRQALNAGVRASEDLVRQIARDAGCMYEGDRPTREGQTYSRTWTGQGATVLARVTLVA